MARSARSNRLGGFIALGVMLVIFVLLPLAKWAVGVWIDWLWYGEMGQRAVFVTRIVSSLVTGVSFSAVAFVVLFGSMTIARKLAPRTVPAPLPETLPEQVADALERFRDRMGGFLDRGVLIVALVLAFLNGLGMVRYWARFRIALTGERFGYVDPQFGRDVGFYVFRLPALDTVSEWLMGLLVLTTFLTLAVHLLGGAIQPWARLKGFAPHVKAHLSVLMSGIVLAWAFRYWLRIWELNYSARGQVTGASYTDIHAQLPAYRILIVISLLTAVALLLNIRYKGWRLPITAVGVWVALSILVGGVYPALVQRFVVTPNEAALEAPYITRNIDMTKRAFALEDVVAMPYAAAESLTATDVVADRDTLRNVRLWDPKIVAQSYSQLQSIRTYYEFPDVDVDRYTIDGKKQQVLVSAREMNSSQLPSTSQTWVNRHLIYTHGFGLVMSPVNESDTRGMPRFIIGNIPPKTTTDLVTKEPRLYFGEATTNYAIVDTGIKEFDYPQGEKNAEYEYAGKAGIPIGSLARRLAWAFHLGSSQVLFSEYVKPESRVLIRRDLTTRIEELAPWLRLESDPYPVLVDGRVLWVVDAYTSSRWYPYSQGLSNGTTYLRNSVKITVDAFDGTTTFYAFDDKDPVLKAWRGVFPSLFVDGDKIPEAVRQHFRYPQELFVDQAEVYRTYHMSDPRVFYNKEDQWEIPGERQGRTMEPFFVLMKLPGESAEHFYIMQPYTPRNRDNMIGWVAANSDPDGYGKRVVYQFPKERVVLGPDQVSAQINQDPSISPQLSLWNQRGSQVIFGNMLVLPIKDSIVYVQPLYLQAEQTAIPELTRVVVVYADRVVMENTLEAALLKVFGQAAPEGGVTPPSGPSNSPGAADAATAQRLYEEAIAAQKKGDWALYGTKIDELGKVLERLSSAETSTSAK